MQGSLGGVTLKSKDVHTDTGIPAVRSHIIALIMSIQNTQTDGVFFLEEKPAETNRLYFFFSLS